MAALPSPSQVAGTYIGIYEAYYHLVDPHGTGVVQAPEAARFLKKSKLSDVVLSKIWDLSDPTGKGYLDKAGVFVALKLVALAQAGRELPPPAALPAAPAPQPDLGEVPRVPPARPAAPSPVPGGAPALGDWSMRPAERDKYSQLFDSLHPVDGLLPGAKVKGVLLESKLPLETLGRVWDLADQDRDGALDRHEFCVAMHLVYKALEKHAVPTTLPGELRRATCPPPPRPPRPASPAPPHQPPPPQHHPAPALLDLSSPTEPCGGGGGGEWVVPASELAQLGLQFEAADLDRDGLVSGAEIKHLFLETGLPQPTLAHIWALCDTAGRGKLTRDQFALAMWLARRAAQGDPPPSRLPPHYVPPSCRPRSNEQTGGCVGSGGSSPGAGAADGGGGGVSLGPQPTAALESLAREVEALARDRAALAQEVAAKQRELADKTSEADALQSEAETLAATLKQLEHQRGEAQRRLADLAGQVDKLRAQCCAGEAAVAESSAEVGARRAAAASLRDRETALGAELAAARDQADALTATASRHVLALSQAKLKAAHLEEQHRIMETAVAALCAGGAAVGADALALQPQFGADALARLVRGATPSDALEDAFGDGDGGGGVAAVNGFDADPFAAPAGSGAGAADPFAPHPHTQQGAADPFAGAPHDPFAPPAQPAAPAPAPDATWEADPFAVLHAPPPVAPAAAGGGGAPPTPTLPPKRHKTPPPRPAPPKQQHKNGRDASMEFTEDPFKDYRYEDPYNIEDPFAELSGPEATEPFGRPASAGGLAVRFPPPATVNGRVSAPPAHNNNNDEGWAAWPDAWPDGGTAWPAPAPTAPAARDAWATRDPWPADWNANETWPSSTLPAPAHTKKEKSPKPVKYARSLVHTIGGIGRARHKKGARGTGAAGAAAAGAEGTCAASEEQQWAWAAAESRRVHAEEDARRRQEDARRRQEDTELQLALAISRQDK